MLCANKKFRLVHKIHLLKNGDSDPIHLQSVPTLFVAVPRSNFATLGSIE